MSSVTLTSKKTSTMKIKPEQKIIRTGLIKVTYDFDYAETAEEALTGVKFNDGRGAEVCCEIFDILNMKDAHKLSKFRIEATAGKRPAGAGWVRLSFESGERERWNHITGTYAPQKAVYITDGSGNTNDIPEGVAAVFKGLLSTDGVVWARVVDKVARKPFKHPDCEVCNGVK